MSDNPYAAPAASEPALAQSPKKDSPLLALGVWLTGALSCGAEFAAERLLPARIQAPSWVYTVSICLCAAGLVLMKQRWFVTLGLAVLTFFGIIAELLLVGRVEILLRGLK